MKRTVTGIAAAALAIGTLVPAAFAATTTTTLKQASQLPIVVNGSVLSNPFEMTGMDSGNTTGFFPVFYFNQALSKLGFSATWNGVSHTWAITASGVDATKIAIPGGVGTGNTTITVNGTTVKKINTQVAKDPAGGASAQETTYLPVFYINEILNALGVNGSFTGQTGLSIVTSTSAGSFSTFAVSGNQSGVGTATSPAVSSNGGALSLATTLTGSNGSPLANTSVSLTIAGTSQPVVSANGTYVTATNDGAGNYTATATTDANGKLNLTVVGSGSYTVTVNDGASVTTSAYLAFLGTSGLLTSVAKPNISSVSNATAGVTPVTFTLPLDSKGAVQKDTEVTFTFSGATAAEFTTAAGQVIGNTVNVYSDANGQATVYVNDFTKQDVTVQAVVTGSAATPASTVLSYQDPNATTAGTVSLANIGAFAFSSLVGSASNTSPNTVTGVPSTSWAFFAPVGSDKAPLTTANANGTYTLSANDGYNISGIKVDNAAAGDFGTALTIPTVLANSSNLTLSVKYNTTTSKYDYSINGIAAGSGFDANFAVQLAAGTSATGTTPTLNVVSGSVSANAGFSFGSAAAVNVTSFNPVISSLAGTGTNETISFVVNDANGAAVANKAVKITIPDATNLKGEWITAVNGKQLAEPLGANGSSVYTPVPLNQTGEAVSYDVGLPGLATWSHSTNATTLTVYTDANGKVTLTLQNGDVWYASGTTSFVNAVDATTAVSGENLYAYTPNIAATAGVLDLVAGTTASAPTFVQVSGTTAPTATQVGQINN